MAGRLRAVLRGQAALADAAASDALHRQLRLQLVQRRVGRIVLTRPSLAAALPPGALGRTIAEFGGGVPELERAIDARGGPAWLRAGEMRRASEQALYVSRKVQLAIFASEEAARSFGLDPQASGVCIVPDVAVCEPSGEPGQNPSLAGPNILLALTPDRTWDEEAALWFTGEVLPALRRMHPDVRIGVHGASSALAQTLLRRDAELMIDRSELPDAVAATAIVVMPRADPALTRIATAAGRATFVLAPAAMPDVKAELVLVGGATGAAPQLRTLLTDAAAVRAALAAQGSTLAHQALAERLAVLETDAA